MRELEEGLEGPSIAALTLSGKTLDETKSRPDGEITVTTLDSFPEATRLPEAAVWRHCRQEDRIPNCTTRPQPSYALFTGKYTTAPTTASTSRSACPTGLFVTLLNVCYDGGGVFLAKAYSE